MNTENLLKMAAHIRTIPQDRFEMGVFRPYYDYVAQECFTVGCVIGHCTALDNPGNIPRHKDGDIDFRGWSVSFTGLSLNSSCWYWCFSSNWEDVDNTPEGAARRIEWLVENGLPANWHSQMSGRAPLCYNQEDTSE